MTKEEIVAELQPRLRAMEDIAAEARGAVKTLKWVLGIALVICLPAGVWLFSMASDTKSNTAVHESRLTTLDRSLADRTGELKTLLRDGVADLKVILAERVGEIGRQHAAEMARLEQRMAATDKRIDTLDQRTQRVAEVEMPALGGGVCAAVSGTTDQICDQAGYVGRVGKNTITLEEKRAGAKVEYTHDVDPFARVVIKDKTAKLEDLKPGMHVVLVRMGGNKVELIKTVPDAPARPGNRMPQPPTTAPPLLVPQPARSAYNPR